MLMEQEVAFAEERKTMKNPTAAQKNILKEPQQEAAETWVETGKMREAVRMMSEQVREVVEKVGEGCQRGGGRKNLGVDVGETSW